MNINTHD